MAKIDPLLAVVETAEATDLHLVSGSVPLVRVGGQLEKTHHRSLTPDQVQSLMFELLTDDQIRRFQSGGDLDIAYGSPGGTRYRINIYQTQSGPAAAIRLIPSAIATLDELGFSDTVRKLADSRAGLILVTGPTNSGKTTTLAAMVDHINTNFAKHIITLEDPIEYLHASKNSLVSQRQIGLHARDFASALRASLREDPDVILVGEMRDMETISLAVTAAEVGLLVMGTLHTCSAPATIDRIVDVFPPEQQEQIRIMLAESLTGIVSQQLLRRAEGRGRIAAYELLVQTTSISGMIRERKTHQIATAMQTGRKQGMQLLDNHLRELVDQGLITPWEAVKVASDPSKFFPSTAAPGQGPLAPPAMTPSKRTVAS